MKIVVYSWRGAALLEGKPYSHDQTIEGTEADAVRIVGELFATGLNVMLCRPSTGGVMVAVDNYRFQQM